MDRLLAFGPARLQFLHENREIARAAMGGRMAVPAGPPAAMTQRHLRMLLAQLHVGVTDVDILTMQLAAALEVPFLLYTAPQGGKGTDEQFEDRLGRGWEELVRRLTS